MSSSSDGRVGHLAVFYAKKIWVRKGLVMGPFNMGILSWVIGSILPSLIVFPMYLIACLRFKAAAEAERTMT